MLTSQIKEKPASALQRRLPVGAEVQQPGGVHFRVWAPRHQRIDVVFEGRNDAVQLNNDGNGYFSGLAPEAKVGDLYKLRINSGDAWPDPVSRYQPQGVHGPSQVIDPGAFRWTDKDWKGVTSHGQVLYEFHVGTFTREGTWAAAQRQIPYLKELGVTCLEIMPVNEFAGRWGWGYDGVYLYAPFHHYGSADDFRKFIDALHAAGIGAILDVVYNHLGPDGNYLTKFSTEYFNAEHHTDWGDALNYDGENSAPVREYFVNNALHWILEYHLDGFRFDASQAIVDTSKEHVLAEINRRTKEAVPHKTLYLINENEPQNTNLVRPREQGGYGMDGLWNDDFHHSALVAISGHNEAYYTDYLGSAQELLSTAKWGYLYQGQRYKWQKRRRGTPALDLPPTSFVHFIQNHDQVANSGRGYRAHQITSPGEFKAITALMLLMPQTPMLFQGQEFGASSTFHYFADHNEELTKLIRVGRAKEIAQFPSNATDEMQACLVDPGAEETFQRSKIDLDERHKPGHKEIFQLHVDLLRLRREEPTFRRVQRRGDIDGAILGPRTLLLRYFASEGPAHGEVMGAGDRLLLVNFDSDLELNPAPEPLLAPPPGYRWQKLLSTDEPQYGGSGTAPVDTELEGWRIPARSAIVLKPAPAKEAEVQTRHRVEGSAQEAKKKEKPKSS
ncbi:MAG TPA: malto-oligosyltrehalose trehalohydrolase [Tepidisphaeraceae bacterium]|jgi:maltooligosyltrehalose trehalohydrolase